MSKRDTRKALEIPLSRELRRALRAAARGKAGLAATARRISRNIVFEEVTAHELPPAEGRRLVLQLSKSERLALCDLAARLRVSPETAVLYALHHWAAAHPQKSASQ